ncbi:MAG: endolytic transglycosylase MltG [Chitinophagaceae bacterium]
MSKKKNTILLLLTNTTRRIIKISFLFVISILLFLSILFLVPNTYKDKHFYYIEIYQNNKSVDSLYQQLQDKYIIKYNFPFLLLSKFVSLSTHIQAGRYEIEAGSSTFRIVSTFFYGEQEPIRIAINGGKNIGHVVSILKQKFPIDSIQFIKIFENTVRELDATLTQPQTLTILLPNTYEFYWTTGYKDIIKKWYKYHQKFWNDERLKKAEEKGLTPASTYILASIVEEEANLDSEKSLIASVYLNRLKKNMYLGACPTVIYAIGDFSLRRLYNKHLSINSPYNTYINKGLPPGPICLPSPKTIDIVLNAPPTNYLYFVANSHLPGRHIFTTNHIDHNKAAKKYQYYLNKKNIVR